MSALADALLLIGEKVPVSAWQLSWGTLVVESDRIFRMIEPHSSRMMIDGVALAFAKAILASNRLGVATGEHNSSITQSQKARAAKKRKSDERGQSIRCGIIWVCTKQKLKLLASNAFAESIRTDVIEAAKRFGLKNCRSGTSARSLERHIAVLIKDSRLLNAILEECELQELS